MIRLLAFILISSFFIYISRKMLTRPNSHGFYRFFAWEFILAIILLNIPYWIKSPFSSIYEVISILLCLTSIFLVVHGVRLLKIIGKPDQSRSDSELLPFEKTSKLVTVGAYKYIRHPLYSSLLFLAWGAFFKNPSLLVLPLACAASLFLALTAKQDESECLQYFGDEYQTYMQKTKKFIPFIF